MKKNILIISISIVVFIIALVFFMYATKLNSNNKVEENIIITNENYVEEVSKTKTIENVTYNDFIIYKEDGTEVKLSQYSNMPIMLLFFDSKLENSVTVLQKVEDMYKKYEDKIKFIMINTNQEVDKTLKDKYTLEIYYDFYKEASRNYNVSELPSMIYINEENEVFNSKSGLVTTDALEANLDILSNNI